MSLEDRPQSEYWSVQRGLFWLRVRGFLSLCTVVFGMLGPTLLVGVLFNAWALYRRQTPFDQQSQVLYQTRNIAIAAAVSHVLTLLSFVLRRWIAEARPVPLGAVHAGALSNWATRLAYLWGVRLSWPLLLASSVAIANSHPREAAIPALIGAVVFAIWLFGVRTFGPFTVNTGGRLERR